MNKLPCFLVVLILGILPFPLAAGPQVSQQAGRDFEWFETLGYPDVKDIPWVEVTRALEGNPPAIVCQGFLLKSGKEEIEVLPLDAQARVVKREMVSLMGKEVVKWTEIPFDRVAREYAGGLKQEQENPARNYQPYWGLRLGLKAQAFFMACACWKKGFLEEAEVIFEAAKDIPPQSLVPLEKTKLRSIREDVERELAHAATWRAVAAMGGPVFTVPPTEEIPTRKESLEEFLKIQKNFPLNPHRDLVDRTVSTLEQMVAEDAKHPALSPGAIAALPVDEQVREWVFRLRDQNGRQMSQPGYCDIFGEFGLVTDPDSPAHQLVKIGYPAVPRLIEALDDQRLTRSVEFSRDYFFSHRVLTTGDCARQILNRIARQNFLNSVGKFPDDQEAKYRADYRQAVEKWWQEFKETGEEGKLVAEISAGVHDPRKLIARLREVAPQRVEAAVVAGAEQSGGNLLYLDELGSLKTPEARKALAHFMQKGDSLRTRVESARQLWMQGDPGAVPAMVA